MLSELQISGEVHSAYPVQGVGYMEPRVGVDIVYRVYVFFFSSRRRHTRLQGDWSSDVCSSNLPQADLGIISHEQGAEFFVGKLALEDEQLGTLLMGDDSKVCLRLPTLEAHQVREIGRASCRERV